MEQHPTQQMVCTSSTHKGERNRLSYLPNTIQIWGGSFQITTRQTLCDLYFVQHIPLKENRDEHLRIVHIAHQIYISPKYTGNGKTLNLVRYFMQISQSLKEIIPLSLSGIHHNSSLMEGEG